MYCIHLTVEIFLFHDNGERKDVPLDRLNTKLMRVNEVKARPKRQSE